MLPELRPTLLLALLLAPAAVAAPTDAVADGSDAPAAATRSAGTVLELKTDLHQASDLTLPGTHADRHIDFPMPRSWELKADPVMQVELSHSASLIPSRSHVTVLLNDHPVGSVTLDEGNVEAGSFQVRLPRSLLRDYNTVRFSVVQHYTNDCEDPFDPTLWTRISNLSTIEVDYTLKPVTDGLEAWPFPVVDARQIGPIEVTPVLTGTPSPETTRAAGDVALTLGRLASYHTLQVEESVQRVEDAKTTALIVGTLDEHPEVQTLLGPLTLGPTDGIVAIVPNPANKGLPVLIVSGGGAEGVARAAKALTAQDRQPALAGPTSVVRSVVDASPPPNAQTPRPAPREGVFPISALGFESRTVRGFFSESIRIPVRLEGDTYIRPGGGTLNLRYGYSAQLDPVLSAMEVRLDGLAIRSVPLDRIEGRQDGELSLRLPEDLITPDSTIDVVFHLYPREFDECKRISDQQIWGTLFDSSTVEIPRDHVADMPDLARLRFDGWPFRADAVDGGVIAVLPDAPDAVAWSAGLELAALVGRQSHATDPDFHLELAIATSMSQNATSHFIILSDLGRSTIYDSLAAAKALASTDAGLARTLAGSDGAAVAVAEDSLPSDTIEQILQPSNHQRSALVLRAGSEGGLGRLVDAIGDATTLDRLEGNLVVVAADGSVRVVDTARKERWGTLPIITEARIEVRNYWGVLGAAMVVAGFAIALVVRIWSRPRKSA